MIIKGRSPNLRRVARTHRIDLDWLVERVREDPGISVKYVGTKHQIADMLTKGQFTAQQWDALCELSQTVKRRPSINNTKKINLPLSLEETSSVVVASIPTKFRRARSAKTLLQTPGRLLVAHEKHLSQNSGGQQPRKSCLKRAQPLPQFAAPSFLCFGSSAAMEIVNAIEDAMQNDETPSEIAAAIAEHDEDAAVIWWNAELRRRRNINAKDVLCTITSVLPPPALSCAHCKQPHAKGSYCANRWCPAASSSSSWKKRSDDSSYSSWPRHASHASSSWEERPQEHPASSSAPAWQDHEWQSSWWNWNKY